MEVKKLSTMLKEGTLRDQLSAEQEEKDKARDTKNTQLDDELKQRQAAHKKEQEPAGITSTPDFNDEKMQVVDQIGEIVFYALKDGNKEPLKEVKALIAKYPNYLKSQPLNVKTFTNYDSDSTRQDYIGAATG